MTDLSGQKFGMLTAMWPCGAKGNSRFVYYMCACDCGRYKAITSTTLRTTRPSLKKSCGCLVYAAVGDLTGTTWGLVSVIGPAEESSRTPALLGRIWACRCVCGKEMVLSTGDLRKRKVGCKDCANKSRRKVDTGINALWCRYKSSTKKTGRVWALSREQFRVLTSSPCFYCGANPAKEIAGNDRYPEGAYTFNRIDRLDNGQGYLPDNSVPCCWPCNNKKRDTPKTEFLAWVSQIYHYRIASPQSSALAA